jgi:hypothetical protein
MASASALRDEEIMNRILEIPDVERTPEQSAVFEQLIARCGKLLTP